MFMLYVPFKSIFHVIAESTFAQQDTRDDKCKCVEGHAVHILLLLIVASGYAVAEVTCKHYRAL